MKLGIVTLWTNGRPEDPLFLSPPGEAPTPRAQRRRRSVRPTTDVLAPVAKPMFAIEGDPLLAASDAAFDLASMPLPAGSRGESPKAKRSRKRAPKSNRGRAA